MVRTWGTTYPTERGIVIVSVSQPIFSFRLKCVCCGETQDSNSSILTTSENNINGIFSSRVTDLVSVAGNKN